MNFALTLDHTKKQWVDLGIHTEACMTRPETCGAAGGAISVWVKIRDCHGQGGIISSQTNAASGTLLFCTDHMLWYYPTFSEKSDRQEFDEFRV